MVQFTKLSKKSQDHIITWQERGLIITDYERANRYLGFIGYYRLSAYAIPFQLSKAPNHQFKNNTTFDDLLNLYIFDRELRLLVMDAIERIEVAVRTQISNIMCTHYNNAFWYTDGQHFDYNYGHMRLLANIERQLLDEKTA
ncbi:Abi-like protein [Acinetobacter calcoaceticus]|uniref:Abi-like protein n=1 Tax=Acinetobacter calcoaceticus TaxID=471 RepID=A0A4R1XPI2_ACICA|nr:Abi-like protein [Acinetobacter calcoaceticus]